MEPVCVIYRGTGSARVCTQHSNSSTHTQSGLIKISLEPPLSLSLPPFSSLSVRLSLDERLSIRGCSSTSMRAPAEQRFDPLNGQLTSGFWHAARNKRVIFNKKRRNDEKIRSRPCPNFHDSFPVFYLLKRGPPQFLTRSEIDARRRRFDPRENLCSRV